MNNENKEEAKEMNTFIKYGLAAMINEYNSLEENRKKEYMDALTEWYVREKGNREYNDLKSKE